MAELWKRLHGRIDERRFAYTLDNLVNFVEDAQKSRDAMAEAFEEHTGRKRDDVLSRLTVSSLAAVGTYNVRHFGAVGDGTANDAPAINKAINACNKVGGGIVFVPSGYYTTGSIQLKSNVTLAIDKGAVLKAMPGIMDPWEPNPNDKGLMDPAYYHWGASLIWGKNLENALSRVVTMQSWPPVARTCSSIMSPSTPAGMDSTYPSVKTFWSLTAISMRSAMKTATRLGAAMRLNSAAICP
jgi:hypothetical protein